MWDDEDNDPYRSFHRRDSDQSEVQSPADPSVIAPFGQSSPSGPQDYTAQYGQRSTDLSDEELGDDAQDDEARSRPPATREGGYDSRVEQILDANPHLDIHIIYAGKNPEGGGGFITYTIRTGDVEVRRRYSEFASLRSTLLKLHPTLIIPPIPEKHSIADYAAKPTKARKMPVSSSCVNGCWQPSSTVAEECVKSAMMACSGASSTRT